MTKRFTTAPLPFQGQKRHFVKPFIAALDEIAASGSGAGASSSADTGAPSFGDAGAPATDGHGSADAGTPVSGDITTIVDLFGGSGLLAHTAKRHLPDCRVVYNDFDGYTGRLAAIPTTNEILGQLRRIVAGTPKTRGLDAATRDRVLELVADYDRRGFVDYITLSASLLFPGKYALDFGQLTKSGLYNRVRQTDFDVNPADYLAGLEIRRSDYKELFEEFRDVPGVVFLADPPYLSTDTKTYASDKYWHLRDYLDVQKVLMGSRYIYFTSNKSSLPELGRWLGENVGMGDPFEGATLKTRSNSVNPLAGYEDMMLYKLSA